MRAPQLFFDMMAGTEAEKQMARQGVVDWMRRQKLKPGGIVTIPDPETGAETQVQYQPAKRQH